MHAFLTRRSATAILLAGAASPTAALAAPSPLATAIDGHVRAYAATRNFAGVVLVERDGAVIFLKAYGDAGAGKPNTPSTRFHVASVSMQHTAAAVLRLVDQGKIRLDDRVSTVVPDIAAGERITIRHLLQQRSGLADINDLPDYDQILAAHQTPASLVERIRGLPPAFEPGANQRHEHSAYNLLALIIEKKTGQPFARALRPLVFEPARLAATGADDDDAPATDMAQGYAPAGAFGLEPARAIHWSGKAGNASIYTTAADHARFVRALTRGPFLSPAMRAAMFDAEDRAGFGWFKAKSQTFGQLTYSMNGRSPGFSSYVLHIPAERLTVLAFSNIYSSATTDVGFGVAKIVMGKPVERFSPSAPLSEAALRRAEGAFKFASDFYQPDALVRIGAANGELALRWPSGDVSPLIPAGPDQFIDRAYWETVTLKRDGAGRATGLTYGRFEGVRQGGD